MQNAKERDPELAGRQPADGVLLLFFVIGFLFYLAVLVGLVEVDRLVLGLEADDGADVFGGLSGGALLGVVVGFGHVVHLSELCG